MGTRSTVCMGCTFLPYGWKLLPLEPLVGFCL